MKNVKILVSYDDTDQSIVADVFDGILISDRYAITYDKMSVALATVTPVYGHKGVYSTDAELFEIEVGDDFDISSLYHFGLTEFLMCIAEHNVIVKDMNA